MDSTAFITGSEWTHNSGYSAGEGSTFAPTTGLFAPFPEGQSKDGLAEGTYGLFDGARDTSGYLHATPPAATPLRRARSLNINASPSLPARSGNDQLSSPSSPLSDALQTPRDGQQLNAGSSWFAVEQTSFLNSLAAASGGASSSQQQQQDSSSTLFASHLATPASDVTLRERRRCPSAQAALGSTSASSYQGSNLSLAIPDARSAAMAQQPSIEDVNQVSASAGLRRVLSVQTADQRRRLTVLQRHVRDPRPQCHVGHLPSFRLPRAANLTGLLSPRDRRAELPSADVPSERCHP